MPIPLKPGHIFKIEHKIKGGSYSMDSTDVYRDFYGISLFMRGDRFLLTPGNTYHIHSGNAVFIHKNMYHRGMSANSDTYESYSIKFKESVVAPLKKAIGDQAFDELFDQVAVRISEEGKLHIEALFEKIFAEWELYDGQPNPQSELLLTGYINEFFISVLRTRVYEFDGELGLTTSYPPLIDALKYMEKHFVSSPSLSETAREVGLSPSHLSKMFSSKLNTTYSRFLNEEKINHAQKLLVGSHLSMVEVAEQSGFSSSHYFCDVFKKQSELHL